MLCLFYKIVRSHVLSEITRKYGKTIKLDDNLTKNKLKLPRQLYIILPIFLSRCDRPALVPIIGWYFGSYVTIVDPPFFVKY